MLVAVGIPSAGFIRYYLWMLVSPHDFLAQKTMEIAVLLPLNRTDHGYEPTNSQMLLRRLPIGEAVPVGARGETGTRLVVLCTIDLYRTCLSKRHPAPTMGRA